MAKLTIGLTGGISSGKTTITKLFTQHDIDIVDADIIAREIVVPNTYAYNEIVNKFGNVILEKDGYLNRAKLRQLIFQDPQLKKWLEILTHPIIIDTIKQRIQQAASPYCILVAPLLLETNNQYLVNRLLVIDCDRELQIERTMQRDNCSLQQAENIISQQLKNSQRLAHADDIIVNNSDLANLEKQVNKLHLAYLQLVPK